MSEYVYAGLTSQTIDVFLQDSSSTTGAGLSGLVYNSSGLKAYYRKGATGTSTAITLATQTVGGAYSSGGFVEIDATNMKGVYRLDLPNAMVDTEGFVTLYIYGATNLLSTPMRIDCRALPSDIKKFGGTAGTFSSGRPEVNATHWAGTAVASATVRSDLRSILGTSLSELGSGNLAASFSSMYDVATPVFTVACVNQTANVANGVRLADGVAHGGTTASLTLSAVVVNNPSGIGVTVTGSTYGYKFVGTANSSGWHVSANSQPGVIYEMANGNMTTVQANLTGKILGGGSSTIVAEGVWALNQDGQDIATGGGGDATLANQLTMLNYLANNPIRIRDAKINDKLLNPVVRGDAYDDVRWPAWRWTVEKDYTSGWTGVLQIRKRDDQETILLEVAVTVESATSLAVMPSTTDTQFTGLEIVDYGRHPFTLTMTKGAENETIIPDGIAVLFYRNL